jgi:hypothetical protein
MTRTITLKELVLEELNRQLAEEGRDVKVLAERPRPALVAERGRVVQFGAARDGEDK